MQNVVQQFSGRQRRMMPKAMRQLFEARQAQERNQA
jgi:hypothetical protein